MKIVIIGAGVSGLVAARILSRDHEVHVCEAGKYAGGHANSVDVELGGKHFVVDTGFMVFNDRTYPMFSRLLQILGTPARDSDMSFSVRCDQTGIEYQGSSLRGLFAQPRNALRLSFYRMLADIARFNRRSRKFAAARDTEISLGQFVEQGNYGQRFCHQYLIPMIAAIWSARPSSVFDFPAIFMIRFLENHGLLQVCDRPTWKTIPGGSRSYLQSLIAPFRDRIRLGTPVKSISRHANHVAIESAGCRERFDVAILATHADQSLKMLADADEVERSVLGGFSYQTNEAVLHTDVSMLPKRRRAWASWNYRVTASADQPASVTYDLSRLQGIDSPQPILLTLNPAASIDSAKILRHFTYRHPIFSLDSITSQRRFAAMNGRRGTYFCGAYRFNGFHEDGVASALEVGAHFGKGIEDAKLPV